MDHILLCDIILCLVYKLFDHTTLTDESIYIGYDKRADGATVFLYCLPVQRLDLLAAQQRRFTELAPTAAATTSHSILVGKRSSTTTLYRPMLRLDHERAGHGVKS